MSGIGDMLFGSEGSPAQVVDPTPKPFRKLRAPVSQELRSIIRTDGGPQYTGPYTADIRPEEQQLLDELMRMSGSQPGTDQSKDYYSRVVGGDYLSPESNPFLQGVLDTATRQLRQTYDEVTLPRLRQNFTAAGQMVQPQSSSPFDMAVARATSGLLDSVGDTTGNILFGNYEAERQRQGDAAAKLPQIETEELNRTIASLQEQALPRLIEQYGVDQGLAEFERRVNVLLQALAIGGGLSSGQPVVLPGTEGSGGLVGSLLGGAGQAAGSAAGAAAGSAIFSDRRLKADIERIGTLPTTGLGIYSFRYKGGFAVHAGLMADEVETVIPEAVSEHGGFKAVDYAMVFEREAA